MASNARALERLGILAPILFLVEQHDVGRELDDAVDLGILRTADFLDRADAIGGVDAELRATHELIAAAEVENELGQAKDTSDTIRIRQKLQARVASASIASSPSLPAMADRLFASDVVFTHEIITREELKAKMDRGDDFTLFEVLPLMYWRKHHLPGAKSLPPTQVATIVPELVPDHDAEIVLYCWDDDCPTSGWAGRRARGHGIHEHPRVFGRQEGLDRRRAPNGEGLTRQDS